MDRLRIEPAGPAAIAMKSSRMIRRDSVVCCLLSIALLLMLFFVFYRRWSAGLVIGGVAAVGMLAGIGVVAPHIGEVSPLAAMIAALLAGLGTDYGVHFLSHYDGHRAAGLESAAASVETARSMAVPIGTNCMTSIFGFISLWPSQIQMLRDFAVMGAAGLIGALVSLFVLMPAVLAVVDGRSTTTPALRETVGRWTDGVGRRPRLFVAVSLMLPLILTASAAMRGFDLRFETDLRVMHPQPSPELEATDEIVRRFRDQGTLIPVEVRASSSRELLIGAHDATAAFRSEACSKIGVSGVMGLSTLLPDPRRIESRSRLLKSIDSEQVLRSFDVAIEESLFDPDAYRGYREFLATILTTKHAPGIGSILQNRALAQRLFPADQIDECGEPRCTVLIVRLAAPLRNRIERQSVIATLVAAAERVESAEVTVAGIAAASEELERAARSDLPRSIAISIVLVIVWLLVVFRRPEEVCLALIPLLFAAGTTVLVVVATGQKFNPINSVAIPLLGGIAVDAGVFLVSVYRTHGSSPAGLRLHLRSTVHAVTLSVATTITAFASLAIAHTPAIRSLGIISAIGIAASGVGAIFLLMPILLQRSQSRPSTEP